MGGHLSWFELGGGRWHARPVGHSSHHFRILLTHLQICNFLSAMVAEINLDAIKADLNGKPAAPEAKAYFDPVRRKLQVIDA